MGQNTTWTYEDCARSTVRQSGVVQRVRSAVPLGSAPVILRWSGLVYTCRPFQACAGRRHVRPSYHTGGTGITILLALDARGHFTVAPTSSGLAA